MKINGIHMHTGSDILDIDVFLHAAEILFDTAKHFKKLEFLDFGSGFKVPYHSNDIETNIEELGEKLSVRFTKFCKDYGSELQLIFEPGKFLVSQAGHFITQVNVVKQTTSTIFAQVDSGFNHLIRPMLMALITILKTYLIPMVRSGFTLWLVTYVKQILLVVTEKLQR